MVLQSSPSIPLAPTVKENWSPPETMTHEAVVSRRWKDTDTAENDRTKLAFGMAIGLQHLQSSSRVGISKC